MNKIDHDAIGKRIKNARETKGLTQEEFSYLIGKQINTVKSIEYGERGMSLQTLLDISNVLDISIDFIIKGISDNRISPERKPHIESISTTIAQMTDDELIMLDSFSKYSLEERLKIKNKK